MISFKRHARKTTITIHTVTGLDGQGKPAYATPGVSVEAWTAQSSTVTRLGNGDDIATPVTVWVDGEAEVTPQSQDLIKENGVPLGVVVERVVGRALQSRRIDHVRCRLREV